VINLEKTSELIPLKVAIWLEKNKEKLKLDGYSNFFYREQNRKYIRIYSEENIEFPKEVFKYPVIICKTSQVIFEQSIAEKKVKKKVKEFREKIEKILRT